MEILQRGQPPSERTYTQTCMDCRTVYRFKAGEAKYQSDQRDGDAYETGCPVCGRKNWISVRKHD